MPVQLWEALKWVVVISSIGFWLRYLPKFYYKFFIGDEVEEKGNKQ